MDAQDDRQSRYSQAEVKLGGYQSRKKRYFYGFKVHLLFTAKSQPVEFLLNEGSRHISKA